MAGNHGARDDVLGREGRRLHEARALGKGEIGVAHVHEVHRPTAQKFSTAMVTLEQIQPRRHGRRHAGHAPVVIAEAHDIFALTGQTGMKGPSDPTGRPPQVAASQSARTASRHGADGSSLGRRAAVAQQPAVKGEAAVGADDRLGPARCREHALHAEPDAVEHGVPDHLAQIGQQDQEMAAAVRRVARPRRLCQNGRCWRATRRSARPFAPSLRNSRAARRIQRFRSISTSCLSSNDVYNFRTGKWKKLASGPNVAPNMAYLGWGIT